MIAYYKSSPIYFLLSIIATVEAQWFLNCPPSGYLACAITDVPFVVNTYTTVRDCIFEGCPQVRLVAASLTLSNVTFKNNNYTNNGGQDGGAILMSGNPNTNLTVINCKFMGLSSGNGGSICFRGPLTGSISISHSEFTSNSASGNGGAIYSNGLVTLALDHLIFLGNSALTGGALFHDRQAVVTLTNCQCVLNFAFFWGGCFYVGDGSTMVARNLISNSDSANDHGGFAFMDINAVVDISNLDVLNSTAPRSSCFFTAGPLTLHLQNSVFRNPSCMPFDSHITFDSSTAIFTNVSFFNAMSGYLITNYGSHVTYNGGLIQGHNGIVVLFQIANQNLFFFNYVVFKDIIETGPGAVMSLNNGFVQLTNCQVLNAVTESGGIFSLNTANAQLNRTLINGALVLSGDGGLANIYEGNLVFGDGVVVRNVTCAAGRGGLFYLSGSQNISFLSQDIVFQDYQASDPYSSFAYLATNGGGLFDGTNLQHASIDPGTIYVLGATTAGQLLNSQFLSNFFSSDISWNSDIPSTLRILNYSSIEHQNILFTSRFPTISVIPVGYFGNDLSFNPNVPYVIVKLKEVSNNAAVTGEIVKAIVDTSSNMVSFKNYNVRNRQAGLYRFVVEGAYGTMQVIPGIENPWPILDIAVSNCDPVNERFIAITLSCAPVIQVNSGAAITFIVISVHSNAKDCICKHV